MKNLLISSLIIVITFSITACTPDSPVNTGTSTPFTLKYEITTSAPIAPSPLFGYIPVSYSNATQQNEIDQSFISGTIWSKEFTVSTPNRPFDAVFTTGGNGLTLSSPGTVTSKIYVNGAVVASATNATIGVNNSVTVLMDYLIY